MVASALKAYALDVKFLSELNLDPGPVVVLSLPLVPFLLTWAEKVLRLAELFTGSDDVMLSNDTCSHVEMVLLHACCHHSCLHDRLLHDWLHENLLSGLLEDHLRLRLNEDFGSWLLNHDLRTHATLAQMIEHDLTELDSLHVPVVVEIKLDLLSLKVDLRELNLLPVVEEEVQLPVRNLVPATFK